MNLLPSFSSSSSHFAMVDDGDKFLVWGHNNNGQLGLGHTNDVLTPEHLELPNTEKIVHYASGRIHTLVATESGNVFSWGSNKYGQLGLGCKGDPQTSPQLVGGLSNIVQVSCGIYFSAAVNEEGELFVWGAGDSVEAIRWGLPRNSKRTDTPELVEGITKVKQIACGFNHMLILTQESTLFAWGNNLLGQLGVGDVEERRSPIRVPLQFTPSFIACGERFTVALSTEGQLFGWGSNNYGQLGLGDKQSRLTPIMVMPGCKSVAAGGWHCTLLNNKDEIWLWGKNDMGQMGTTLLNERGIDKSSGSTLFYDTPQQLDLGMQQTPIFIGCGGNMTCLISVQGQPYNWGERKVPVEGSAPVENHIFTTRYVRTFREQQRQQLREQTITEYNNFHQLLVPPELLQPIIKNLVTTSLADPKSIIQHSPEMWRVMKEYLQQQLDEECRGIELAENLPAIKCSKQLAVGSQGTIFEGSWNGQDGFAIKIRDSTIRFTKHWKREVTHLLVCSREHWKHPNIVVAHAASANELVLEKGYCNLRQFISSTKLPLSQVHSLCIEIATGVTYLHALNIVHRDLKCENILLFGGGHIKICDFGLARNMDTMAHGTMTDIGGTVKYRPLDCGDYEERFDVWSFGIIVHKILESIHSADPNSTVQEEEAPEDLKKQFHELLATFYYKVIILSRAEALTSFLNFKWQALSSCVAWLPRDRPYFREILQILLNLPH